MKISQERNLSLHMNDGQMLGILTTISMLLLSFRIFYSGNLSFTFLAWNMFLAWIPWWISRFVIAQNSYSIWVKWLAVIPWLLFLPNSPYIVTDLFHLYHRSDVPIWYDLVLLFTNAWTGLLLGFASFRHVQKALLSSTSPLRIQAASLFLWFTVAFGVYVGRFLRWNSWDIITNPLGLLKELLEHIIYPHEHMKAVGFTLFFGIFLYVAYIGWQMKRRE